MADHEAALAEDADDTEKMMVMVRYKQYLESHFKCLKINDRGKFISDDLAIKLGGRPQDPTVEVFHISAADYMTWIKAEKIMFKYQPALLPTATGVPRIRQYLYNLPAQQNLRDFSVHVNINVVAFVEKIKRISTQSDRDAGFRTIADDCYKLSEKLLVDILQQAKTLIKKISHTSIVKVTEEVEACKGQVVRLLQQVWLKVHAKTFAKLLISKGTIRPGASSARE